MNKSKLAAVLIGAALLAGTSLMAQGSRKSPHETISTAFLPRNSGRVVITYGRPLTNDRKIWGGLVPYGQIWRTGADEATLLATQNAVQFGDLTVPAGAYTLWTVPEENGGKLIICKTVGQWGTVIPKPDEELGRVDLKREPLDPPVHQFTMAMTKNPDGSGTLKLQWEDAQYTVSFKVQK